MNRTENGTASTSSNPVVPADLIAALSGVRLAVVTRVIAAQDLIVREEIATAAEVTDLSAVPTAMPDSLRVRRCDDAVGYVRNIAHDIPPAIKRLLKRHLWS